MYPACAPRWTAKRRATVGKVGHSKLLVETAFLRGFAGHERARDQTHNPSVAGSRSTLPFSRGVLGFM